MYIYTCHMYIYICLKDIDMDMQMYQYMDIDIYTYWWWAVFCMVVAAGLMAGFPTEHPSIVWKFRASSRTPKHHPAESRTISASDCIIALCPLLNSLCRIHVFWAYKKY